MSYVNPIPGASVTSEYGPRWGTTHLGIDLGASQGTPVKAAKAGTVNWVQHWDGYSKSGNQSYGNVVRIAHADGKTTLYAHLHTIAVRHGQSVNQGQVIGTVGNTGNSFGAHLHFEVATASPFKRHNPRDFVNFSGGATPNPPKAKAIADIKVMVDSLNYRTGPGTSYKVAGAIKDKGVYSITEIKQADGHAWGKLISGAGWIALDYTDHPDYKKPDPNAPSDWAKDVWEEEVKAGTFDGTRPKDPMTREEAAAIVNRLKKGDPREEQR